MSETVTGYIDHIIFRNEENGYTVMVVKNSENEEELTCVGSFPGCIAGGQPSRHPVFIPIILYMENSFRFHLL